MKVFTRHEICNVNIGIEQVTLHYISYMYIYKFCFLNSDNPTDNVERVLQSLFQCIPITVPSVP